LDERKLDTFFVSFIDDDDLIFLPFRFSSSSTSYTFSLSSVASMKNRTSKSCLSMLSDIKVVGLFAINRNLCTLPCIAEDRNPLMYAAQVTGMKFQLHVPEGTSAELCIVMTRSLANWSP
jgi:hypothetical protein